MKRSPNEFGVAILGAGFLGTQRAAACRAIDGVRLVGVVDVDVARARMIADRFRCLHSNTRSDALNWPGVDGVVVATPHDDHAAAIQQALLAGKHVLAEKPMTIDPLEGRALEALAVERGLRLHAGFNHRFYPPVRDALRIARDGQLGALQSVRLTIGHKASAGFLHGWHANPKRSGGGSFIDNGAHACDLARLFLGDPEAVKGYTRYSPGLPAGIETEAFALFRARSGAVGEIRSSWSLESGYLTIELRGEAGYLRVETAPWRLTGRIDGNQRVNHNYIIERAGHLWFRRRTGCERSLVCDVRALAGAAQNAPVSTATARDGHRASEMIEAFYRASESGEEVFLEVNPPVAASRPLKSLEEKRAA